ncbi:MAG: putative hydroxypyruvate isomerase [Pseudomonadota bacterium]|jgi:hydroxypyruvate isomerase
MPQFAANLSMLYPELPFLDRFGAAAADGFTAVEYLFPYDWAPGELVARLVQQGLKQVLFNAPPGGGDDAVAIAAAWAAGDRGTACVPGREAEFRAGVVLALHYASALACPRIHLMAGLLPSGVAREAAHATYVANLRWAAAQAARQGCQVLIEPINTRDMPGFFLNRQAQAHAVLGEVGADNLKVQLDLYHCQISEGDVAMTLRRDLPTGRVGHIQIAGVPQRHEPDVGELNYTYLFEVLDEVAAACRWQGWVGCEYRPARGAVAGGTSAGLGWMR